MNRLALVLPDGFGLRNFALSGFLGTAAEALGMVFHAAPTAWLDKELPATLSSVRWEQMPPFSESAIGGLLRYVRHDAHMMRVRTRAMRHNFRKPFKGSVSHRAQRRMARALATIAGEASMWAQCHDYVVAHHPLVQHYRRVLSSAAPSFVLCSHQRPPQVAPLVHAAKSLGIPTGTCIFSWDNLTTKDAITTPFDYYFVWSDHMRDELLASYPALAPERVFVTGTPQFDVYARETWTRDEFLARLGVPAHLRVICFTGGDPRTCPEDPSHAGLVAQLIRDGRVRQPVVLIVRPAPVDNGARYEGVKRNYPEAIFLQPQWSFERAGDWASVLPTAVDVEFLANLTAHADVNINVASTMTLDFAIHDRPVVNIAFDVASPPPLGTPLRELFYRFEHYETVVRMNAARIATTVDELADGINEALESPELRRSERRSLVELHLGIQPGQSAAALLGAVDAAAAQGCVHRRTAQ